MPSDTNSQRGQGAGVQSWQHSSHVLQANGES